MHHHHHLHSPASPSSHSMSSAMSFSTPALSSGTMSTSSSQDGFPGSSNHSNIGSSPVLLYPSSMQHSPVAGLGLGGQYFQVGTAPSMGKQNSAGSRVYISPPPVSPQAPVRGVDYSATGREHETKGKRKELELGPPPPPAPPSRVLDEPTRKGEEIGIDLGDFDMMDTLGECHAGASAALRRRS